MTPAEAIAIVRYHQAGRTYHEASAPRPEEILADECDRLYGILHRAAAAIEDLVFIPDEEYDALVLVIRAALASEPAPNLPPIKDSGADADGSNEP